MNFLDFWLNVLFPILSLLITVFATIYTVSNRIKYENMEKHRPYIVLSKIESVNKLDLYAYYLIALGRNYRALNESIDIEEIDKLESKNDLNINLIINNIGYGVATNIKFYNLLVGKPIHGSQQSNKEKNQKLFTTFDIAAGEEKKMQTRLVNHIIEEDNIVTEDHHRILCVYQDLNKNIYDFIISINVKQNGYYDFFAYQPSSKSYKRWMKQSRKQLKMILKDYRS